MKSQINRLHLFCITILVLLGTSLACGVELSPTVWTSINDSPIDGTGDSFNIEAGLLQRMVAGMLPADTVNSSVILEYDISGFAGQTISQATLDLGIDALIFDDPQIRAFDLFFYTGNGTADLTDLSITATYLDTLAYSVGSSSVFSIDVSSELSLMLDADEQFLGFRIDPIGSRNPASMINSTPLLNIDQVASSVPEPATVLMLSLGSVVFLGGRKK